MNWEGGEGEDRGGRGGEGTEEGGEGGEGRTCYGTTHSNGGVELAHAANTLAGWSTSLHCSGHKHAPQRYMKQVDLLAHAPCVLATVQGREVSPG